MDFSYKEVPISVTSYADAEDKKLVTRADIIEQNTDVFIGISLVKERNDVIRKLQESQRKYDVDKPAPNVVIINVPKARTRLLARIDFRLSMEKWQKKVRVYGMAREMEIIRKRCMTTLPIISNNASIKLPNGHRIPIRITAKLAWLEEVKV